ncbi:MAG: riboflavin synthase [Acidobacteria bacterium]|nr:riboflavin synthase [Acidobacteriota bacterium]
MFTGIIEELGLVTAWEQNGDAARLTVRAPLAASDAHHGDSIAISGVCLTVIDQGDDWFTADVMAESIAASTVGRLTPGDRVNVERAAAVSSRLGGHIVQGHVDGFTTIISTTDGSAWRVVRLALPAELAALVTRKGSIAVDGISLTVSAVSDAEELDQWFEVSLIPETLEATTLGAKQAGDAVNLETDILARHVQRLLAVERAVEHAHEGVRA